MTRVSLEILGKELNQMEASLGPVNTGTLGGRVVNLGRRFEKQWDKLLSSILGHLWVSKQQSAISKIDNKLTKLNEIYSNLASNIVRTEGRNTRKEMDDFLILNREVIRQLETMEKICGHVIEQYTAKVDTGSIGKIMEDIKDFLKTCKESKEHVEETIKASGSVERQEEVTRRKPLPTKPDKKSIEERENLRKKPNRPPPAKPEKNSIEEREALVRTRPLPAKPDKSVEEREALVRTRPLPAKPEKSVEEREALAREKPLPQKPIFKKTDREELQRFFDEGESVLPKEKPQEPPVKKETQELKKQSLSIEKEGAHPLDFEGLEKKKENVIKNYGRAVERLEKEIKKYETTMNDNEKKDAKNMLSSLKSYVGREELRNDENFLSLLKAKVEQAYELLGFEAPDLRNLEF